MKKKDVISVRKYQIFDKDGLSSVYDPFITAKNKASALLAAKRVYGSGGVGSVKFVGWIKVPRFRN